MEFVILGPTALYADRRPVALGAAKQRAMLGLLLYHVGTPVRIDTLVDQLWDGRRSPEGCRANLYALVSRTRAVLDSVGLGKSLVSVRSPRAYQLNVDPDMVDFHRLKRLIAEARDAASHHHYDTAVATLTTAIGLWQGDPLADLRGAHAEHIRRHMHDVFLEAHRLLAGSRLNIGQHQLALAQLEPFILAGDLDETLAQHWITALCAAGREGDARRFFVTFRRHYRTEMGTEPAVRLPAAINKTPRSRTGARSTLAETNIGQVVPGRCQLLNDIHDFTGHDDLLAQLDTLTNKGGAGTNIALITGMPGIGKTTLAVHWAHLRRHRFPDGQLYLNVNAFGTGPGMGADEALGRFLNALDFPADRMPLSVDGRRDRLNELLVGRRILIILDNVRDSSQARILIPTSASCLTLITSRNRLSGLTIREGVQNITVSPLPDQDCLALLDRAMGASRTMAEPVAARALVRLSGGLPLAMRIIGEHVAERPQTKIADLVDELGSRLLDSEAADDEEANLRTIFGWSYDALTSDVAHLFRLLGLYPGPSISPEAAAAMRGAVAHETEHLLNKLAKSHLINHDSVVRRYRFHDLLQLYAAERAYQEIPPEEQVSALRRLLDWYLLSAANATASLAPDNPPVPDLPSSNGIRPQEFDTDLDAMKWCEAERVNIGAVTRWAATHGYHRHGWQIPGVIHEIYDRYGRQEDVLELHELALSSARQDDHPIGWIGTLNNLGATYFAIHDYHRAVEIWEGSLQLARERGYAEAVDACSHNLASAYLRVGDTEEAVRLYIEVLDACRRASNSLGEASTLHWLGYAYRWMKQYDRAISYYLEALAIRQRTGSLRGQGSTYGELAALHLEIGETDLAFRYCQFATTIHERTKDETTQCDVLTTKADIERERTMYKDAVRDAQCAITISEELGDSRRRSRALAVLADTLLALGDMNAANRLCREAMDLLGDDADLEARSLRKRFVDIANRSHL